MPAPYRVSISAVAALLGVTLLTSCGAGEGFDTGRQPVTTGAPTPSAVGTLRPGFLDPASPPPPEGTLTPAPNSWSDVRPPAGYSVALVVDGVATPSNQGTDTLRYAVQAWATQYAVQLQEVVARRAGRYVTSLQQAINQHPDLVIVVGQGLVDPLALVSAPNLETQFLILGAEIAEPTDNVTAVDWAGAMFRGEGLGLPAGFDPSTFTPERSADAVGAGTAAVLSNITGFVIML